MTRAEDGGKRRRHAFFQDTISVAVPDFWAIGYRVGRGLVAIFNAVPLGNPIFPGKCRHFFGNQNLLAPFSGGVSDVGPDSGCGRCAGLK